MLKGFWESNENIFQNIKNAQPVAPLIVDGNEGCKELDKLIGTKLGAGFFGDVYNINFDDKNTSKYVVKIQNIKFVKVRGIDIYGFPLLSNRTFEDILPQFIKYVSDEYELFHLKVESGRREINNEEIVRYILILTNHHLSLTSKMGLYTNLYYPKGNIFQCLQTLHEPIIIRQHDNSSAVVIPKKNYFCLDNEAFPEYMINILISKLYQEGRTVGILDQFGYNFCENEDKFQMFIFMEKMDGSLTNLIKSLTSKEFLEFFIQITHAVGAYQYYYKICHQDLKPDNILYKKVEKGMKFQDQSISDADWFHYKYKSSNLYLPAQKWIPKIADFGMAAKWSEPMIFSDKSLERDFNPNFYQEFGDIIFLLSQVHYEIEKEGNIELLTDVYSALEITPKIKDEILKSGWRYYYRQNIKNIPTYFEENFTPQKIFENKNILQLYGTRPKTGKIITMGTI
ncbi:hypothetical protein OAG24_00620 [bacterium]|nr:hypothetical protein [bacterium]